MKCSRITLFDRKEKLSKDEKHNCNYQREYNPQLQNYLPWLNKPRSIHEDDRPYLTVCNLVLPNHVRPETRAVSDRWVKKRPRLQSAKLKNCTPRPLPPDSDSDEGDDSVETDSQLMEIQQVMEEYEIDENVQRLIQEAAEYDQRATEKEPTAEKLAEERKPRKTPKNKTKERNNETKEKPRSKLIRALSLSRPPSPETIQVIRVDVTSNYSLEEVQLDSEDAEEDEDDQQEKNPVVGNRLYQAKSFIKQPSARELTLQCQKLALADRRKATQDVK